MIYAFIFYNESFNVPLGMPLHRLFKHCDYVQFDGDAWVTIGFGRRGVRVGMPFQYDSDKIIDNIIATNTVSHFVVVECKQPYVRPWLPVMVRSCNEMSRLMTGLDIPFTLTPFGLYKKLLKYDRKRNYTVLRSWSRLNGVE